MKERLQRAVKFYDDHIDTIAAGIAGLNVGLIVMYVLASREVNNVHPIRAAAHLNEDNTMDVGVVLSNGRRFISNLKPVNPE